MMQQQLAVISEAVMRQTRGLFAGGVTAVIGERFMYATVTGATLAPSGRSYASRQ